MNTNLGFTFNAAEHAPNQGGGFEQLPKGTHPVIIVDSEVKQAKGGSGNGYIEFTLEAIDGPAKGAHGKDRVHIWNASEKAQKIAKGQLSAYCHVTGVLQFQDTQQLHNRPFTVEIVDQKLTAEQIERKENGEDVTPFTEVKRVMDMNGNEPGKPASTPAPAPAPAPAPTQEAPQAWAPQQQVQAQTGTGNPPPWVTSQ